MLTHKRFILNDVLRHTSECNLFREHERTLTSFLAPYLAGDLTGVAASSGLDSSSSMPSS